MPPFSRGVPEPARRHQVDRGQIAHAHNVFFLQFIQKLPQPDGGVIGVQSKYKGDGGVIGQHFPHGKVVHQTVGVAEGQGRHKGAQAHLPVPAVAAEHHQVHVVVLGVPVEQPGADAHDHIRRFSLLLEHFEDLTAVFHVPPP